MSGVLFGATSEQRRHFLLGLAAVFVLVVINNMNNVTTVWHSVPKAGFYAPIIWEASSGLTTLAFLWIPWLAFRMSPPDVPPFWRIPIVHIPAALAYSALHVAGFVLLRQAAYVAAGSHYGYGPLTEEFTYELSKDVLSYVLMIAIFWGIAYLMRMATSDLAPAPVMATGSDPAAVYDIRDGGRLTRVRIEEILAVTSADNYVEFVLGDGRRLMMRKALSAVETELGPQGLLRTHRSWLINPKRMTALKPAGSGDYTVELGTLSVPLSRRFPDVLAKLRAG